MAIFKKPRLLNLVVHAIILSGISGCAAQTLQDAAKGDQADRIHELLKEGQNVNGRDAEDYSPLHWAAYYGRLNAIKALVENGGDLEAAEANGMTPLLVAVYYKQLDAASYLLKCGAKSDAVDVRKWDVLCYAAWNSDDRMTEMLIKAGVPVNPATSDRPSALQVAHKYGNSSIEKILVKHGAHY